MRKVRVGLGVWVRAWELRLEDEEEGFVKEKTAGMSPPVIAVDISSWGYELGLGLGLGLGLRLGLVGLGG